MDFKVYKEKQMKKITDQVNELREYAKNRKGELAELITEAADTIEALLNRESSIEYINLGEWEMFDLITSKWFGKQCYFKQDDGMVYSRKTCKLMTVQDAISEFLAEI